MTANVPVVKETATLIPSEHEIVVYDTMAKSAVASKFYGSNQMGLMALMLSARELNIAPMAAINGGMNIINGKVEISARMMNALIRRAGHSLQTIESSETKCTLKGVRKDNGDEETVSFSLEDAKQAGLIKAGGGWTKFPGDMCYARALSRLARRLFPDVIGMAYVEGEIPEEKKEPEVDQEAELKKFLEEMPKDQVNELEDFIRKVAKSYNKTYTYLIESYHRDSASFLEKFEKWKSQQSVPS